jgi:hypothetical protein
MKIGSILKVLVFSATLAVPFLTTAQNKEAATSSTEYIKVEAKGLIKRVVAIGGETTGYTITSRGIVWELDFGGNKDRLAAADKAIEAKTPAVVKGSLKKLDGIERRNRMIVVVDEFK